MHRLKKWGTKFTKRVISSQPFNRFQRLFRFFVGNKLFYMFMNQKVRLLTFICVFGIKETKKRHIYAKNLKCIYDEPKKKLLKIINNLNLCENEK
jgi:hypothetical protein